MSYDDFWGATTAFDLAAAHDLASNHDELILADALSNMMEGQPASADSELIALRASARDTLVLRAAKLTHGALLYYDEDWARLTDSTLNVTPQSVSRDQAGVNAWGDAFAHVPRPSYSFPSQPVVLQLTLSHSGTPTVPVTIHGRTYNFWLDTGSSLTVLASDVAEACGIHALSSDTLQALGAVARISAFPALVPSLELGGIVFRDVPGMIVDEDALRIGVWREGIAAAADAKVDGIIGFDVIRRMNVLIDYGHSTVTLSKPEPELHPRPRNLFWYGIPIVRTYTDRGIPAYFLLDTGADETFATLPLVSKINGQPSMAERRQIRGFGNSTTARGVVLPAVQLWIGKTPVTLQRVFLYSAQYPTIFSMDGTLAADVARGGKLRIDMTNGRFEVSK